MHIKSRDPISVTAVLGHFEVYDITYMIYGISRTGFESRPYRLRI